MENELILLSEYCERSFAEPDFILRLESEGLIETIMQNDLKYIPNTQLGNLELFIRLHYDLSINVEGIDVINNLLGKVRSMEHELNILRRRLDAEPFSIEDFFDEF